MLPFLSTVFAYIQTIDAGEAVRWATPAAFFISAWGGMRVALRRTEQDVKEMRQDIKELGERLYHNAEDLRRDLSALCEIVSYLKGREEGRNP